MLWNPGSILPRRNEVIAQLHSNACDILLVTETWLSPSIVFSVPDYSVIRKDRASRRGGVAIIINNSIKFSVARIRTDVELLVIQLFQPKLFIGVIYVTPGYILSRCNFDTILHCGSPFLIGGDWNAKHSYWHNTVANKAGTVLYNFMLRSNFRIVAPTSPTHYQPRCKPSVIDFFITDSTLSFECTVLDHFGTAHRLVLIKNILTTSINSPELYNSIIDWDRYFEATQSWIIKRKFLSAKELDDEVINLNEFILSTVSNSRIASPKTSSALGRDAIANDVILTSLIKMRRKARKYLQHTALHYFSVIIKEHSKSISRRISFLRQSAWISMLNHFTKPDPTFWALYRSFSSKNRALPSPFFEVGGIKIYSPFDQADALANTFYSVHSGALGLSSNNSHKVQHFYDNFDWSSTSDNEEPLLLSPYEMKPRKASGPDHIT
ncbi:hypothetical protein KPH14_001277, partial [Odynerus spinipes]